MEEVPKELFNIGNPGEKREYLFIGLEGEEELVFLDFGDRLSDKRCPLDGAYLVIYNGDPHNVIECPACHKYGFNLSVGSPEDIPTKVTPYIKHRIERLNEEINHLESILRLAQDPNNEIKKSNLQNKVYNKANLSANSLEKTSRNIRTDDFSYESI